MALLCLVGPAFAPAADENLWPLRTTEESAGGAAVRTQALGPLVFDDRLSDRLEHGLRPLFLHRTRTDGTVQDYLFFPFFRRTARAGDVRWSFFSLINSDRRAASGAEPADWHAFDVWPFYFSRATGSPETSYRALFPLQGTIKRRFGNDRIDFTLFPLYSRWQKGERVEHDLVWPIFREIHGGGEAGWAVWPLYGWREKDGGATARSRFALWPLWLEADRKVEGGTDRFRALWPLYSQRRAPGRRDDDVLLFFGATHQTSPVAYDETRYLWPLFVQGRGADGRYVNRWAPLYTHSIRSNGTDKKWYLWPLVRRERWTEAELAQTKTQLLYFVYWDLTQRDPARPAAAAAHKTHLWPLFSAWDNGAGRRQVQALSPFEVFYQHDDEVRQLWSPLFALYRFDRRGADTVRTSFLFNCVTYRRQAAAWKIDLGPLCRFGHDGSRARFAVLPALFDRSAPSSPVPAPAAGHP